MTKKLLQLIFLLYASVVCCQEISDYPLYPSIQNFNTPFTGAIYIPADNVKLYSDLGIRQFSGLFNDVRQIAFRASYNNDRHNYGLSVYSEEEGEIISNTRAYFKYTVDIKLNSLYTLKGGISFGGISKSYNHNQSKWSATATTLDANIGAGLLGKNSYTAFSINQLPSSDLFLVGKGLNYARYFSFYYKNKLMLARQKFSFTGNYDLRGSNNDVFAMQITWEHNDLLGIAMSMSTKGLLVMNGKVNFLMNGKQANVLFGYETGTGLFGDRYRVNMFHLTLQYFLFHPKE